MNRVGTVHPICAGQGDAAPASVRAPLMLCEAAGRGQMVSLFFRAAIEKREAARVIVPAHA